MAALSGPPHSLHTHRLLRSGNIIRKPVGLCQQGGTDLDAGLHTFTRTSTRVTCPECIEWMHA